MRSTGHLRVVVLAISDCILLYGVWAGVTVGYHATGLGHYDPGFYMQMWPVGPVFVAVNYFFRLYHGSILYPAAPLSPVEELRRLVGSAMLTHIGVIAALALVRQTTEDYSRVVIVASGLFVAFSAQSFRDVVRKLLAVCGWGRIPVVVAGGGDVADRIVSLLESDTYTGFRVVARFWDAPSREIVAAAQAKNVRVLIACQDVRLFQCQMEDFSRWFTHIEYLPTSKAFPILGARAVTFDGLGGLEMVNQGRMKILRIQKWLLDKVLASLAFLMLLPALPEPYKGAVSPCGMQTPADSSEKSGGICT